jgi:HAE1 family hydrophobic/amphiphilic exporter-1
VTKKVVGVFVFVRRFRCQELFHEKWIDPEKMSSYNIAPKDVRMPSREQNVEAAPGKIGETEGIYEYVIKYKGRLSEVKDYENIIIKSTGNGNFLRIKDVAR